MNLADLAEANGLKRVGGRPPLLSYLAETWGRREFIMAMAVFRIRANLERNRLGILWLVLRPCLNALIYGLIFYYLQGDRRPTDYAAHIVIGVFLFEFFSRSLTDGAKSITGNRALVQSLAFPRLTLPVAEVVEQFLNLLPTFLVLGVLLPLLGHFPTWSWLLMIPLLAIYTLFNLGVALIGARLTVHIQDLTQLLPFVTRILFYTSGVLFDVNRLLSDHPALMRVFDFHPIYQVLQIARSALMGGAYDVNYWWMLSVTSIGMVIVGLLFFWSAEERYGRD